MNFTFNQDQQAIDDVAIRIFRDLCNDDHIRQLYREEQPLHRALWSQLAASGLLGTPFSTKFGGSEMGMTELCLVLQAQGQHVAPIPLLETIVECALPIAHFATEKLSQELIPKVINGEYLLAPVRPYQGLQNYPALTVRTDEEQWILDGYSNVSGYGVYADGFLITAQLDNHRHWVGFCRADSPGVCITPQRATNGESSAHVQFETVKIEPHHCIAINDEAEALLQWQRQRTYAAMAAIQIGVLSEGLRRAADYTKDRTQFNRPLAAFQSVAQQMADGYMAIEALRGVYWRQLDIIDNGNCPTERALLAAHTTKFWICESGHTAAHIFLHVHGGIGQDLDFPIHRYFSWAKKNELYLGTAADHSQSLGRLTQSRPELLYQ